MVKDSTDFDTVDEYKADIKAKLEESAEKAADAKVEGDIFDKVIENMTAEIPDVMYENRVNEMVAELEQRMASQGISLDMYMQFTGQNIDTIKKGYAEQAEKQVKLRLALEKIAELEKVEVTDEELEEEFKNLSETYKMEVDQIKALIPAENLKMDLSVGKAVDIIKESAVIK
jgi:trigger factor